MLKRIILNAQNLQSKTKTIQTESKINSISSSTLILSINC